MSRKAKIVIATTPKNKNVKGHIEMSKEDTNSTPELPEIGSTEEVDSIETGVDEFAPAVADDKPTRNGIRLPIHDDFEPPAEMLNSVKNQVIAAMPRLIRGVRYTTKVICGRAYWKALLKGERILAGVCLSYLVARGELPLVAVVLNKSHAKLYAVK